MVIVKLIGGLGNQMFEYALGRALAKRNNTEMKLDVSGFKDDPNKRIYSLGFFNTIQNFATPPEIAEFKKYDWKKGKFWFWYNRLFADSTKYVREKGFNFEEKILILKSPLYLEGFWQTEKYFEEIKNIIKKEFTLKNSLSNQSKLFEERINGTESISLHVRRGDYVSDKHTNEWHGSCSLKYYNQAIKIISEKVKNPNFFIFSDDPDWIKENIIPPFPTIYLPGNTEHPEEDMHLMSRCKHNIVANSSFSWWGAWLNKNENKIVIAPKQWFNTPKIDTRDILPESWIKI